MGGVIISEPEEGSPIEDLPWVIVFGVPRRFVGLLHLRAIRAGPHHCPLRTNSAPPTASSVPVTATVRSHGWSPRR